MNRLLTKTSAIVFFASIALVTTSCGNSSNLAPPIVTPDPDPIPDPIPDPVPVVNPGDPRSDLTADELAAFTRGREMFVKRFKPSEGLGPLYNATSCSSCHSKPVAGGASDLYRNFYVAQWGGAGFLFNLQGLPSPVVPAFGGTNNAPFSLASGRIRMVSPNPAASLFFDQRNGIPVFGTGLFESISDATILANADPNDLNGDGISGRSNNDGAGLGRFGSKSQANNIELFTRAPLFNQMGVTSNPVQGSAGTVSLGHGALMQGSATPNAPTADNDGIADPEISTQDLSDLIAFSRFLAPPQKKVFDSAAIRGEQTFEQVGCAACHVPSLESSKGPVEAFTDLLIHNMGPELAGQVSFGTPQPSSIDPMTTEAEWRTAPLWGAANVAPYLHDGRAPTLRDAILLHGGEGAASRTAFQALSATQQEDIIAFLRHL
ncbi:MAG: CxxC motif-containing protein (DUF1111 family) [Planctomycetota bacterium]|jgi:CxxC motif-containing protein (DUF1111 family)